MSQEIGAGLNLEDDVSCIGLRVRGMGDGAVPLCWLVFQLC